MESILISIKKMLGLTEEYEIFDQDIITHINTAIFTLSQLGVNDGNVFMIYDMTETWSDYIPDKKLQSIVKSYIFMKTRYMFDPPTQSYVLEAMKKTMLELEWRIKIELEVINQNGI